MADYDTEVLADSPILYAKCNITSGVTEAELSTNARTLTYNPQSAGAWSGGTLGITGPSTLGSDKAIQGNGTSGYVEIGSHIKVSNSAVGTIEAWVNLSSNPATVVPALAFGRDNSNDLFMVGPRDAFGNGSNRVALNTNSNLIYGNGVMAQGVWYHIVVQSNGSNYLMYLNKVLQTLAVASGANNGTWWSSFVGAGNPYTTMLARMGFGAFVNFTNLKISRVAVYDTVLSSTRIAAHYDNINTAISSGIWSKMSFKAR